MAKFNTPTTLNNGDESKYFKGLTKAEENQIFSQIDALPISQYEKNLRADTMYKDMLNKKKHNQFLNDRMGATNEINDRAASSKDPVESQTLKTQGKFGQLADMVRNLMYEKEGMNLDNFQDEDVVAAFLKDNPNMVDQFNSFMNGDISAESFSERNGFNYNAIDKAVDEVFGSANGTTASYVNQQSEGEWNDELFGRLDTETLDQGASVKGFLKNLAKSTWNVVADVGNMVVNPIDTVNTLAKTAVGAGMNAFGLDENLDDEGWLAEANQVADGLGDFLKERYGGKKEILNTLYSDPMGVVSDIASVVTGGSGIVKSVAGGIAKGAAKVGLANTARTAGNISKTAGRVMNFADKVDPYTQAMRTYAKGGEKVIEYGNKGAEYAKNNINLDSFVGLDSKTKKNIQDNPYSAEVWEKAQNYIEENGLPDKSQRVSKDLMQGVADEVQAEVNKLKQQLGETSPEYKKLKESGAKVSFYDINNKINEILENAGVQISPKGGLDFSKTAISPTEAGAIRRIYNWARTTDEMDIAEYMRYRKAIDQLNLWEDTKGTPGKNVIKEIREAGNTIAHEQVGTLAELDEQYSKMAKELDKVTEGIVYREKRKAGQLKDNFNQILKNLDEPNRRRLSQRLSELLPGVEEKVRAINMLPKLIDNYYRHDHVGDILKSFGVYGGVAGGFGGGIPGAIAGAVGGYFLGNAFNKLKKARWEKALSKLSEQGQERLAEITEKIQNREELSSAEKNYIKAIGKNIEEGNFKENQVSSKTATKQDVFDGLVEAIESITDEGNQYTDADIKVMEQYLEESRKDLSENDYKNLKEFLNYQKNEYEIAKGEREFYESGEAQRIINGEDEKAVKDFQSRILKIENEEKNVGKVAGKKVNRAYAEQQQRNLEAKRERLIEEIGEYYGIDQFEAADKYDQLRDSANVNKVKYQVADDLEAQYEAAVKNGDEARAKEILKEYAESKGYKGTEDYKGKGAWSAPSATVDKADFRNLEKIGEAVEDGYESNLYGVANGYSNMPLDMLDRQNTWRYFRSNTEKEAYYPIREAMDEIQRQMKEYGEVKDMPKVTVYRAVPDYSKSIKKLHKDFDLFSIGEDGKPEIKGSLSQLSKDSLESYDYYSDMYKKYGGKTPLENLYEKLKSDIEYKDSLSVKEGMLESGGEWVTPSKQYAKEHGMNRFDGEYKIIKDDIPADQLWWDGNAIEERGFDDGNNYVVKKGVKNSRKNLEIEYDDKGNLIPLYKRFDESKKDPRFQKYGTAGQGEKGVTAAEGLNIRNFKNGKSVQELADSYGIKTNIVDSISTPTGQKAYGMYGDRVITLAKDLKESTVPHELLHATFDMVDQTKKNQILDGIKERLKVDDVQAEEWLADNFSEYYRTGKFDTKAIPTTLVGKIKQFFQQVKEFVDGTYAERKQIQNLFDDIIDGKLEGEYGAYSDPKFQTVWHGSPAAFEKFDSTHMGEGEGAQAHGWGHYVAVEERTGRHYADMKNPSNYEYKGRGLKDIDKELWSSKPGEKVELIPIRQMLDSDWMSRYQKGERFDIIKKNGLEEASKQLELSKRMYEKNPEYKGRYNIDKRLYDAWKNLDKKDFDFEKPSRNLYNIEIPDPIKKDTPTGSNYLDEHGKLTEKQSEELITKAYNTYNEKKGLKPFDKITMEGVEKIGDEIVKDHQYDTTTFDYKKSFIDGVKEKVADGYSLPEAVDKELKWFTGMSSTINKRKQAAGFFDTLSDEVMEKFNRRNSGNGEGAYKYLTSLLGSDKAASKALESIGYDGIHYFGGRDGEAYVIFNDDALKINSHEQY